MQRLLMRSHFVEKCEIWRHHNSSDSALRLIYDGKVWKDFQSYDGIPFLSEPLSFAFIPNIDWFQPYKHLSYSVGTIYLTVLNLPSNLRFHEDNIILVGILPGPHEPKLTINTYLQPMVDDLLEFWDGVTLNFPERGNKCVRCALLCVSCDLPAGRKT